MTVRELVETLKMFDEDVTVVIGPGIGRGPSRPVGEVQAKIEGVEIEMIILVPATAATTL